MKLALPMWSYYFSSISSMYVPQGRKPGLVVAQTPVPSCSKRFRHEATLRGPGGKFVSKMTFSESLRGSVTVLSTQQPAFEFLLFPNESLKKKTFANRFNWLVVQGKAFL